MSRYIYLVHTNPKMSWIIVAKELKQDSVIAVHFVEEICGLRDDELVVSYFEVEGKVGRHTGPGL